MKFCKTHPDREAVKPYRMCAECLSETKKRLQKKYSAGLKETWMEVNLENLLQDAQKMTIGQLASRYRIHKSTVKKYLSKNNITPKNPFTCGRIPKNDIPDVKCTGFVPDMRLACGNIYPKHLTNYEKSHRSIH